MFWTHLFKIVIWPIWNPCQNAPCVHKWAVTINGPPHNNSNKINCEPVDGSYNQPGLLNGYMCSFTCVFTDDLVARDHLIDSEC